MNKKRFLTHAMLFISLLTAAVFSACDKDTNCYLDVLVVEEGTRTPVSGVGIVISQEHGSIHVDGITEGNGKFSTHFTAPAILNIDATLLVDAENALYRTGKTTVRTKEGETVTAIVTLAQQLHPLK